MNKKNTNITNKQNVKILKTHKKRRILTRRSIRTLMITQK